MAGNDEGVRPAKAGKAPLMVARMFLVNEKTAGNGAGPPRSVACGALPESSDQKGLWPSQKAKVARAKPRITHPADHAKDSHPKPARRLVQFSMV